MLIHGLVNAVPDFARTTNVINGISDLIDKRYGPAGGNSRSHGAWRRYRYQRANFAEHLFLRR